MAKSLNRAELIGYVGRDPEIRSTAAGVPVARWTVATDERMKKGEQWTDVTEWHRCVAFGQVAERIRDYVKKGARIYIEGRMQSEEWDDHETGERKKAQSIVVSDVLFLSTKEQPAQSQAPTKQEVFPDAHQSGGGRGKRGAK